MSRVPDYLKSEETDIRIFCAGKHGAKHDPVHLGAWRKSVNYDRHGAWVSVDAPTNVEYEQPTPGVNVDPRRKPHRSIEMQQIDRGTEFEMQHGYRWQERYRIWCTTCGISVTMLDRKFWSILDKIDAVGNTHNMPLIVIARATEYNDG